MILVFWELFFFIGSFVNFYVYWTYNSLGISIFVNFMCIGYLGYNTIGEDSL